MKILYQKPLLYGDINILLGLIATVFAILIIIFILVLMCADGYKSRVLICLALLIVSCVAEYCLIKKIKEPTEYNRYEVILDDDYPVKELYDNYRVIEQRGEIWVIEDRR